MRKILLDSPSDKFELTAFIMVCSPRAWACAAPPCWGFLGGTSMATPHLAGSAAVVRGAHPNWTAEQVRTALRSSALDVGAPRHDWETGFGLLRLPTE